MLQGRCCVGFDVWTKQKRNLSPRPKTAPKIAGMEEEMQVLNRGLSMPLVLARR